MLLYKELTDQVLSAAYSVHNELGCGFYEKVYQEALAIVLTERNIPYERERHLPVIFHGHELQCDFVADFVIDNKIILELKAVTDMQPVFEAQLINYLKATDMKVGFLMNFGQKEFFFRRMAHYK